MNIRRLFSLHYIDKALREIRNIFPVTILSLLTLFFVATLMIHGGDSSQEFSLWLSLGLSALLASVLFTILEFKMYHEQYDLRRRFTYYAIGVLLTLGFYIGLPKNISSVSAEFLVALVLLFGLLGVVLILERAFLNRSEDDSVIPEVLAHLFSFVQGWIVSLVVFLFGVIVLGTLDLLFDISLRSVWYGQLFVFSAILVFPLFSLVQIVRTSSLDISKIWFFQVVTKFLLIPFTALYGAILYAYIIRVLFFLESWPSGVVPWLIMGYLSLGLLTSLFAKHIDYGHISRLRMVFSLSTFPLLGLLFYAIIIRILAYGWTMNRYFVVMIGIWFLSVAIILFFSNRKSIFKIGLSLVIIMLVTMVGPWSIFAVSERSQTAILIEQLEKVTTFENEVPQPLTIEQRSMHAAELSSLRSRVNYLCEYHGCELIQKWNEARGISENDQYWNTSYNFSEYLGINGYIEQSRTQRINLYADISNIVIDTDRPAQIVGVAEYSEDGIVRYNGRDVTAEIIAEYGKRDSVSITDEQSIEVSNQIVLATEPFFDTPLVVSIGDDVLYIYQLSGSIEGERKTIQNISYFAVSPR